MFDNVDTTIYMPPAAHQRTITHPVDVPEFGQLALTWSADEIGTDNHAGEAYAYVAGCTFRQRAASLDEAIALFAAWASGVDW